MFMPLVSCSTSWATGRLQKCVRHVKNHAREYLTIIWISLLHTWRSYSLLTYILFSAQRTPWWVLTRNTIAKPPVERKPTAWKSLNTGQLSYWELTCTERQIDLICDSTNVTAPQGTLATFVQGNKEVLNTGSLLLSEQLSVDTKCIIILQIG